MAVYGDFLIPARDHIAAAVTTPGELTVPARRAIVTELARLVSAMAGHLSDLTTVGASAVAPVAAPDRPETVVQSVPDLQAALAEAAGRLQQAAAGLNGDLTAYPHPVAGHISAAANQLAAGRDLLQTHFVIDQYGRRTGNSYLAPVIGSPPVTTALLIEIASMAQQLAPWTAGLAVTSPMTPGMPAVGGLALHAASSSLWLTSTAIFAGQQGRHPAAEARRILSVIPAHAIQPRIPLDDETVPVLCRRTVRTAGRLRYLTWDFARQARWSPAATPLSWRRDAYMSALIGHSAETILRQLATRTPYLGVDPEVQDRLLEAATAMRRAWPAYRALACGWDMFKTGLHPGPYISPVTSELADLVLRTGRIAYADSQWTPTTITSTPREPSVLANNSADLRAIVTALHHAADAIAHITAEDLNAMRTAAADARLYVPSRMAPENDGPPRRFTIAPLERTQAIISSGATAAAASYSAAEAMDRLAEAIQAPTTLLAASRAMDPKPESATFTLDQAARQTAPQVAARDRPARFREAKHPVRPPATTTASAARTTPTRRPVSKKLA